MSSDLIAAARAWVAEDPDPTTRAEIESLISSSYFGDDEATVELADRFRAPLGFGTAGLRGRVEGGPNRMNRAVVRRAAAGVAAWVIASGQEAAHSGVVVGRDARTGSEAFADETATVLAGAGVTVHLLPGTVPTPVLAFAVRYLQCAAGVMVTASHNPRGDNGYKVYDGTGRQVVTPAEVEIATAMEAAGPLGHIPVAPLYDERVHRLGTDVADAYADTALSVRRPVTRSTRPLRIAHTALHGVGASAIRATVGRLDGIDLIETASQSEPDPAFPTVSFPNPEEPGALDEVLDLARALQADLVLANDPDADRLAVAVPAGPTWRLLTGDELGWLLADHLVGRETPEPGAMLATTIVSSTLLRDLAADAGVAYAETLTGFKWISRAAGVDQHLLLGYEEALGYCIGDLVADKDGITAALVAVEAAQVAAAEGQSLLDRLDDLARRFGVHATGQWSVRFEDTQGAAAIGTAMAHVRARPPSIVGGRAVIETSDLAAGDEARSLPPADVVTLVLEGARVVARPSGTEPKLKCYLEVVEPVSEDDVRGARERAASALAALRADIPAILGLPDNPPNPETA